jgi:hypothetical protein
MSRFKPSDYIWSEDEVEITDDSRNSSTRIQIGVTCLAKRLIKFLSNTQESQLFREFGLSSVAWTM